jgi:tetratricopeptide (TPR) repeat protein
MQYFQLALDIDPNNALAHVGVANVWALRHQFGMVPRHEVDTLIKTPIEKALELDNTSADAYSMLAGYRCFSEWDWEGAEKAWQQSFRLNPNDAGALASYSHFLCIMGRMEEALQHIERARRLDPLNPFVNYFYGMVMGFNGRLDDALEAFRVVQEIEPSFVLALQAEALMLHFKGMYEEALAIWRKVLADDTELAAALEDGFEKTGYRGALRALADLKADRYGKPGKIEKALNIAEWYIRAGDNEEAIDWFEKAYAEHDPAMPYISLFGYPLRSNPRLQELLRKMNLKVIELEFDRR